MSTEVLISLLSFGGTLLLVLTGLLNFSVFLRQLRAARDQLETVRRQLESARQQPEIQLVQRAMTETSDHLKILIERPYLRPYFYENKLWKEGDHPSGDEVKAMAELLLSNFASAIIHSAAFPQYPVRGVEQTIRFHLRNSPALRDFLLENFDRFPLAGLALICLKNDTKAEVERDLSMLLAAPNMDETERARRERLLSYLRDTDQVNAFELAKCSLEHARSMSLGAGRHPAQAAHEAIA
ncbi:MAG TPA: hypothetical protein VK388_17740 [Pyrinomonadaceae bacterium]|nr:hypothetical protein [Pyrinomonadaceae bacterium]